MKLLMRSCNDQHFQTYSRGMARYRAQKVKNLEFLPNFNCEMSTKIQDFLHLALENAHHNAQVCPRVLGVAKPHRKLHFD